MKIYVASSWRNNWQSTVVKKLRIEGHEVYDFRHPKEGDRGFSWSEIDPNWKEWSRRQYVEGLRHPLAAEGFRSDMDAMKACDTVVAVQPFGRSASMELGWAVGKGKRTVIYLDADGGEPELMIKMCDFICATWQEVIAALNVPREVKP